MIRGYFLLITCVFLVMISATFANPPQVHNPLCGNASIRSFKIHPGFLHFSLEDLYGDREDPYFLHTLQRSGIEVCALSPHQIPQPIQELMGRLGSIHKRVADTFGKDFLAYTLPEGLQIEFRPSERGAQHFRTGKTLQLRAFADWKGETIDDSAYIRQLGHFLMESPALASWDSPLLREGLADLLALLLTGKASTMDGLPKCFEKHVRGALTAGEVGFSSSAQFFGQHALTQQLYQACCEGNPQDPLMEANLRDHVASVCGLTQIDLRRAEYEAILQGYSLLPSQGFSPAQCFDPANHLFQEFTCDRYSMGAVLSHFLFDLSESIHARSLVKRLVRYLVYLAHQPIPLERFACTLGQHPLTDTVHVSVKSELDTLFHLIKLNLDREELLVFDVLWDQYGMDLGMDVEFLYQQHQRAAEIAGQYFFRTIKEDILFWQRHRACARQKDFNLKTFVEPAGCEVTCQRYP
jgi:hypothetical protein